MIRSLFYRNEVSVGKESKGRRECAMQVEGRTTNSGEEREGDKLGLGLGAGDSLQKICSELWYGM